MEILASGLPLPNAVYSRLIERHGSLKSQLLIVALLPAVLASRITTRQDGHSTARRLYQGNVCGLYCLAQALSDTGAAMVVLALTLSASWSEEK